MSRGLESQKWEDRRRAILEEGARGTTNSVEIAERHKDLFKNSHVVQQTRLQFPELRIFRVGPRRNPS